MRLVFDVESIGLHGEAFAVGWVVIDGDGNELAARSAACHPDKAAGRETDRSWVRQNVPELDYDCASPREVREVFWREWMLAKANGAELWAECAWPVEARFLAACIDDDPTARGWDGPYPLHDVATAMHMAHMDLHATYGRNGDETPAHDPMRDARQSARLLLEAERMERVK
jgi:hypothetical protein